MRADAGRDPNLDANHDDGSDGPSSFSVDRRERRRADRLEPKERRRARRIERREARARERAALKRLSGRERFRAWWRARPLGMTFTVYLAVYLAVATVLAMSMIEVLAAWNNGYYELEVRLDNGSTRRGAIDSGPYIYDSNAGELLPASELDLPGDGSYAVFIATGDWGTGSDYVPDGGRTISSIYATMDLVRSGQVQLYDWGLNYNEGFPQEEVLEVNSAISADNLARYDELSRKGRAQSVELFESMTGTDLEETFGEGLVSNTAYYAASQPPSSLMPWLLTFATGLCPVIAYGGLGWLMFRHFYRVHIAGPLGQLASAADRIAGRDLDFSIDTVRGRELGRLSETLEHMRASLLEAQRELWRTAESRRRLNAAFAHDLRTPITVLKGTVEMARMRLQRGDALEPGDLDVLTAQVERLERYATSMGGLTKLEDRPVEREACMDYKLLGRLAAHAREVVAARGSGLRVDVELGESSYEPCAAAGPCDVAEAASAMAHVGAEPSGAPAGPMTLRLDIPLVEEVLDNLLSNACGHASSRILVRAGLCDGELRLEVIDDGPGFSPEALHRGCDPYFSENKSAEHFGLGLNVSSVLCGLHGGALELSNDPVLGARVVATFDTHAE